MPLLPLDTSTHCYLRFVLTIHRSASTAPRVMVQRPRSSARPAPRHLARPPARSSLRQPARPLGRARPLDRPPAVQWFPYRKGQWWPSCMLQAGHGSSSGTVNPPEVRMGGPEFREGG